MLGFPRIILTSCAAQLCNDVPERRPRHGAQRNLIANKFKRVLCPTILLISLIYRFPAED